MKGKGKTEVAGALWRKSSTGEDEKVAGDQWSGDTADGHKPDSTWPPLIHQDFKKVHLLHLS